MGDEATGLIGCAQKGVPYADEGGPWLEVFSDPADREVMGEDGEPKTVNVDETAIYWEVQSCFANKKEVRTGNFPSGIWFGGKKYTVTREDETENDPRIKYVNMAEGGGQSPSRTLVLATRRCSIMLPLSLSNCGRCCALSRNLGSVVSTRDCSIASIGITSDRDSGRRLSSSKS